MSFGKHLFGFYHFQTDIAVITGKISIIVCGQAWGACQAGMKVEGIWG